MRRLVLVGLTLTTVFAIAAVAIAQTYAVPTLTGQLKVLPTKKSGTKKNPKNALIDTRFQVNAESNSTIRRIEYTIPKNVKLNGTGFKKCTVDFISQNGDDACPAGSKVGTGSAVALLGPSKSRLDFDIEIYAAGAKTLSLYLQTNLFNVAIPGQIVGQKVNVDIPERVQRPVPGLYAYVTEVNALLGKQAGIPAAVKTGKGKSRRTRFFASLQGCQKGRHVGGVKIFFVANPSPPPFESLSTKATSNCKK